MKLNTQSLLCIKNKTSTAVLVETVLHILSILCKPSKLGDKSLKNICTFTYIRNTYITLKRVKVANFSGAFCVGYKSIKECKDITNTSYTWGCSHLVTNHTIYIRRVVSSQLVTIKVTIHPTQHLDNS